MDGEAGAEVLFQTLQSFVIFIGSFSSYRQAHLLMVTGLREATLLISEFETGFQTG